MLRRIRRAAGKVRDLDVHRELLKEISKTPPPADAGKHEPSRAGRSHGEPSRDEWSPSERSPGKSSPSERHPGKRHPSERHPGERNPRIAERLRRDAEFLRKTLKQRRHRAARDLVRMLRCHTGQIAAALESLLDALASAENLSLTPGRLASETRAWYRGRIASQRSRGKTVDKLHDARKAAKLARYIAESSPGSAALGKAFEALQEAGGVWHDRLTLAQTAGDACGRRAALTTRLRAETAAALTRYRNQLRDSRSRLGKESPA